MIEFHTEAFSLELNYPFSISNFSRSNTPIALVRLQYEGLIGYGEASMPPYLGETQESASHFFSKVSLRNFEPSQYLSIIEYIDNLEPGHHAAKAAIDIALHDLIAKIKGIPCYELLGSDPAKMPFTSFTIGIDHPEIIAIKMKDAAPFHFIKVKLGSAQDQVIINTIRSISDKPIYVDANRGWGSKEYALEMIEWLESYFAKENITLFMVTHDRYFLERVCNEILELDEGRIYKYKGNYSYYLQNKEERLALEATNLGKAKSLFKKELEWMRKQPKARTTKSKSRTDDFYEIKEKAHQRRKDHHIQLEINMERLGSKILELHKVYKSFGDKKILEGFDYVFKRGERLGIIGKNGTGKSSFLNIITEKAPLDAGKVILGETVKYGYYTQAGIEIKEVYSAADRGAVSPELPGEFPYTRGVQPDMYRGRL